MAAEPVAALVHDPALADQPRACPVRCRGRALAIENERLAAEVRRQLDEVRASRARIVVAGDAERRRVERDLHDGAQQRLVTLALRSRSPEARSRTDPELAASLDRAGRELDLALGELRELARGLHPTVLAEEGLSGRRRGARRSIAVPVSSASTSRRCFRRRSRQPPTSSLRRR